MVRYLTARELLKDAGLAGSLSEELLHFEVVQKWFTYLPPGVNDRRLLGTGIQSLALG